MNNHCWCPTRKRIMRTLLYKEIRETSKLALAGGLLLAGVLGFAQHSYSVQLQMLILGSGHASGNMQPLLGEEILLFLPLFCAVFGTLRLAPRSLIFVPSH